MNILVVHLSSFGDIVTTTPCLRALRQHDALARITVVVNREYLPLLIRNPNIDEFLIREDAKPLRRWRSVVQAATGLARRRGPHFDMAFDLQGGFHSAVWVQFSRARWKGGFGWPTRRPGWNYVVPLDPQQHLVESRTAILRAAQIAVTDLHPELFPCPVADEALQTRLETCGVKTKRFVVVNPFTAWRSKEWPLDRYERIIRNINTACGWPVIISASPKEADRAEDLTKSVGLGRCFSFARDLTLDLAISLYRHAAVLLTGDTGPMHAAAALGTPVVALFGPTWPEATGPWGKGHHVIQASRPEKHADYQSDDGRHMRAIREEEVSAVMERVLASLSK